MNPLVAAVLTPINSLLMLAIGTGGMRQVFAGAKALVETARRRAAMTDRFHMRPADKRQAALHPMVSSACS